MVTQQSTEKLYDGLQVIESVINTDAGELAGSFHVMRNYSIYNTIYAMMQMQARKQKITPIRTFNQWRDLGYSVNKGAKAIRILFPVYVNIPLKDENGNPKKDEKGKIMTFKKLVNFTEKRIHFSMVETNCPTMPKTQSIDNYNIDLALKNLKIKTTEFESIDGNVGGYASKDKDGNRVIAINNMWNDNDCLHTMFHEMAHIVLKHADNDYAKNCGLYEYEADMTAFIVCKFLGIANERMQKRCKAYIQSWLKDDYADATSDKEVHKIMSAVDKILKAGI